MPPTHTARRQRDSLVMRVLYSLPLIGQIARDISKSVDNVFYAVIILVTAVVVGVQVWGLVALAMTALAMVPIMFVLLIMISRG